jgi:hypothetical protein
VADLFQHQRKQADAFRDAVNLHSRIRELAANGIQNDGEPKTSSSDADNRRDDTCELLSVRALFFGLYRDTIPISAILLRAVLGFESGRARNDEFQG